MPALKLVVLSLLPLTLLALSGCTSAPRAPSPDEPTLTAKLAAQQHDDHLYQALGGQQGVAAIVETFLYRMADDRRVVKRFDYTQVDHVQQMLNEQVCALSGGPCHYSGDSMVRVHRGLNISEDEYQAVVEDFTYALEQQNVTAATRQQLLERMAPLHDDIVGL